MNFKQMTCICQMGKFDKQTWRFYTYNSSLKRIHISLYASIPLCTFNYPLLSVIPILFNHALHPNVFCSLYRSSSWRMEEFNTKVHRTTSHGLTTTWRWNGRRRWDERVWQRMCGPLKAVLRWSERVFEGSVQESSRWSVTPTPS